MMRGFTLGHEHVYDSALIAGPVMKLGRYEGYNGGYAFLVLADAVDEALQANLNGYPYAVYELALEGAGDTHSNWLLVDRPVTRKVLGVADLAAWTPA